MDRLLKILERGSPLFVVLGLIFVGLQLKQSNDAVRAQTRSQISIAYAEFIAARSLNEGILATEMKIRSGEPLEGIDLARYRASLTAVLRLAENSFYQYREGNYSESEFQGEKDFWSRYLAGSVNRELWEQVKRDFSPEFRNEIDELLN